MLLKMHAPEFILKSAGVVLDDLMSKSESPLSLSEEEVESPSAETGYKAKSTEELKNLLNSAIADEQYELASKIRDELNNRKVS